ncbi:SCARECROW-like 8 [Actinidia rufa]|uniref:SCARECROW-like 8 n=1 Tax=Actinidia rufa TaxID=165716 RepID=A0A7J0ECQ8_9ERIC|nr:SCARECROW-like 8 [Actinidia rufa]
MSSGFSGDFFTAGGFTGRSMAINNPQNIYNLADPGFSDPSPATRFDRKTISGRVPNPASTASAAAASFGALSQKREASDLPKPLPNFPNLFRFSPLLFRRTSLRFLLPPLFLSSPAISTRYGLPILQPQQIRPQPINFGNGNSVIPFNHPNFSGVSYPNLLPNRGVNRETGEESEKKMMNRLHELEKQLLDDNEDDEGDAVSVITNSEWSETIQNLIGSTQKPISPTSSSSSCSSSSASPQILSPKQSLIEAATAISEGKTEVCVGDPHAPEPGRKHQRHRRTEVDGVHGFRTSIAREPHGAPSTGGRAVRRRARNLNPNVLRSLAVLQARRLGVEENEVLAVNFAFRLYKLPDESVTTENLRDELLRRVRGLSPAVVTVVEQEMSANTAPFMARVTEACGYYGAVFDSLDATVSRENPDRVRIEEGLSRKAANSVACEGRDRVERCEVFGKWRARMGMAGFNPKPLSPLVSDSLRTLLNSGTCGNPGFTVKAETGGVCFGWMGRTLTVASAWR